MAGRAWSGVALFPGRPNDSSVLGHPARGEERLSHAAALVDGGNGRGEHAVHVLRSHSDRSRSRKKPVRCRQAPNHDDIGTHVGRYRRCDLPKHAARRDLVALWLHGICGRRRSSASRS